MILITEFMDSDAVEWLSARFAISYRPELADQQDAIPALLSNVRVLIVRNRTQVTDVLLEAGADLSMIGRLGVGLDNIDLDACRKRSIDVVPATGANNRSVAEYVLASAAFLLRGAFAMNEAMLAGEWPRAHASGCELQDKRLGLIGFGAIARETAMLATSLGMQCCAHDPFVGKDDPAWEIAERMSFDQLLETSDIVSLHVPLTNDTRHLIDAAALNRMKKEAVLINAARGGIVDEAAVSDALIEKQLGGAALDVFETEPLTAEAAKPFHGAPNLILTPHIAGVTAESNRRVSFLIAEKTAEHLAQNG